MTLDTYAHVMADVDGSDRVSAEASIRAAREAEVSGECPPRSAEAAPPPENARVLGEPALGLEPRTSSLQVWIGHEALSAVDHGRSAYAAKSHPRRGSCAATGGVCDGRDIRVLYVGRQAGGPVDGAARRRVGGGPDPACGSAILGPDRDDEKQLEHPSRCRRVGLWTPLADVAHLVARR